MKTPLLMFNVSVETGQVMFVVAVSLLLPGLHKLHGRTAATVERVAPYAIGARCGVLHFATDKFFSLARLVEAAALWQQVGAWWRRCISSTVACRYHFSGF